MMTSNENLTVYRCLEKTNVRSRGTEFPLVVPKIYNCRARPVATMPLEDHARRGCFGACGGSYIAGAIA